MWQKFSLRARINLLLALVLTLGLAVNIARLVLEAGPRVQAEDQSVIRLAREFIETIVTGLNEAPDAEVRLNQIVHDLNRLRHVSITRQGAKRSRDRGSGQPGRQYRCTLAAGMVCHACSPRKDHRRRADLDQGKTGFAADHVASERRDGRDLGWNYHAQLQIGTVVAIVLLLITIRVVSRALAPIQTFSDAMTKIRLVAMIRA